MAFSTAITGLKASTTELDVTGNNIANSSTVGFKSARTEFSDIFATVVVGSGSANSPGSGVIVSDIAQDFTAGTIQFTNNNLDLAIDGTGFFQLNDGQGGITYTRAGGFELDKDGNVVSKNGNFLQGFGLDAAGNRQPIGNLAVSQKESPPKATSDMDLSFNIDSRATPSNLAYDPDDSATFTFSTTNSTFDSLGNENTIKFDMIEQGAWRERQSISLIDFAGLGLNAGDSFSLAGGTISVVAAGTPPDPALGQIGDDTTAANFASRVAAIFNDAATPLQNQVGWDNRIREVSDDGSGNLEITWAASAADVRPVVLNHIDTVGTGTTTALTNVNTQDPFFAANKVESYAFSVPAPPLTGTNPFITIGATQVGINTTMSASDIVDEIIKNTNAILSANPEIDTITKDSSTGQLVITYDPELGDEPTVPVSSTNVTGLTIGAGSFDETGDNSYQGVYQMHALFNNSTPLNIGRPPQPGSGLTTSEAGPILLTFDTTNGLLQTVNGLPVSATGSAPSITIAGADPANPNNTISLDLSGTTQFASESIVKASTQDGFTKGDLIGVTFSAEGVMVASFSNGQNSNLGIVALASFENQSGLQPVGDTAWSATLASGQAILNPPGTGLNGQLRSAALEQSNVNLSEELVALIEAQRNFQANSKTLQTENQVTQTILQIN
ncbi:flagellar hook-basal body complex protein [Motiliproteus sp.]|uniref:flagellar hook-basal body complex protein n=1 Tax=Motiliproteus sp. TaxID=1898955 RepID=UPI003BAAB37A